MKYIRKNRNKTKKMAKGRQEEQQHRAKKTQMKVKKTEELRPRPR